MQLILPAGLDALIGATVGIGLGLGYVLGMLIAPSSGQVTRAWMLERMDSKAREKVREIEAHAGEMA